MDIHHTETGGNLDFIAMLFFLQVSDWIGQTDAILGTVARLLVIVLTSLRIVAIIKESKKTKE